MGAAETTEKIKDGAYMYFDAKIDSFSSFATIGLKSEAVPTAISERTGILVYIFHSSPKRLCLT